MYSAIPYLCSRSSLSPLPFLNLVFACAAQILSFLGNFPSPPSWKPPFQPLNYVLTGPLILGPSKYHRCVCSLFPTSYCEHPRAGLSLFQPPPSCSARNLAYPRCLADTGKFCKFEKKRKNNHPKSAWYLTTSTKPKDT